MRSDNSRCSILPPSRGRNGRKFKSRMARLQRNTALPSVVLIKPVLADHNDSELRRNVQAGPARIVSRRFTGGSCAISSMCMVAPSGVISILDGACPQSAETILCAHSCRNMDRNASSVKMRCPVKQVYSKKITVTGCSTISVLPIFSMRQRFTERTTWPDLCYDRPSGFQRRCLPRAKLSRFDALLGLNHRFGRKHPADCHRDS